LSDRRSISFAGVAAVLAFLVFVARFWHPVYGFTYFIELGSVREGRTIEAFKQYPVYIHPASFGYDGQYYAQIAHFPLLRSSELRTATDGLAYRARKILVPAAAWLLGAGQPWWIIQAYALINVGCWLILAALLWRLFDVVDWRAWIAWFGMLFSAGALMSVRYALIDLPALLLVTAALYAAERRRSNAAIGWLAAAALARESSLGAFATVWTEPGRSPRALGRNAVRVGLATLPLLAWIGYVTWRAGSVDIGDGNFGVPIAGLLINWRDRLRAIVAGSPEWAGLLAMASLIVQLALIVKHRRPDDPVWRIGAVFAALMLVLGLPMWDASPNSAMRVLLPLNLATNLIAVRHLQGRSATGWLVAANLTVFLGILTMSGGASNANEVAIARQGGASSVLELGTGWSGWLHEAQPPWGSTASPGHLIVRAWPQTRVIDLVVTFALQAPKSSLGTISTAGRVLWHGQLAEGGRVPLVLPITVTGGKADLELDVATDADFLANGLGVAMYDPHIRVTGVR
jgi:hypothetical protein